MCLDVLWSPPHLWCAFLKWSKQKGKWRRHTYRTVTNRQLYFTVKLSCRLDIYLPTAAKHLKLTLFLLLNKLILFSSLFKGLKKGGVRGLGALIKLSKKV